MNVLFLHYYGINPTGGGISRMTSVLGNALLNNKICVYYLSFIKNEKIQYDENQLFFPDATNPLSDVNKEFLINLCKNKSVDILINQSTTLTAVTKLTYCVKPLNIKILSVIHNSLLTPIHNFAALHEFEFAKNRLSFILPIFRMKCVISVLKNLYRLKYYRHYSSLHENSDRVVVVSKNNISEFLYVINKRQSRKVIAIDNAFLLEDYNYKDKDKEILWVGTPDFSVKRIDLALKIWKLVYQKNTDWFFTIIGDSHYLGQAKKFAENNELVNVRFVGRQDPQEFYKRSSILCMTSTTESFGLVLIEAMHFGVIPFAFNSFPAVSDIIEDKKNGVLISPFDVNEYSEKITELINNADNSNMAINCIENSKRYSIELIVKYWLILLIEL